MAHKVCLIRGDGIGPEIAEAARRCLDAAVATTRGRQGIEWTFAEAGVDVMETAGTPLPDETIEAIKAADASIKAPDHHALGTGFRSVNVHLRQAWTSTPACGRARATPASAAGTRTSTW